MALAFVYPRSLATLQFTEYYGLYIGLGLVLLLVRPILSLIRTLYRPASRRLRSYWRLLLPVWVCGQRIIPGYEAVVFCLLIIANALSIAVGPADNTSTVVQSLGQVAVINLIPVSLGAHMNHVANACGVPYERYSRFHSWLGAIVVAEAALHSVLAAEQHGYGGPAHYVTGILATSSIGAIAVMSLPWFRRRMFELFTNLHTLLVTAALVALWLHLPASSFRRGPRLYLLLASSAFASTKLGRFINIVYLSTSFGGSSIATIQDRGGGIEMRIRMARPLRFKAGQYIYLSLWHLSTLSALEFHPFQICWAYRDESGRQVIVLLAQPRRGFTGKLSGSSSRTYRAFIEGPYEDYVGVSGRPRPARLTCGQILDMKLYIPGRSLAERVSDSTVKKLGTHGRITLTYTAMRADQLIAEEISKRKGRTLVSLCTNPKTARAVIEVVQSVGDESIRTEMLDFQP
ncbi:hypothetical protein F4824DRAFT_269740 [Ustulina deusta]|nr:hypothetical protein F4824DRAFT_269740 [Ustulina deusta]